MENASKALIIAGAILLAILLISLGIMIFNQAQDTVSGSGMTKAEISAFNNQLLKYEGKQKGSVVKSMIQEVTASNASDTAAGNGRSVSIIYGSKNPPATSDISSSKTYNVKMEIDSNSGYINKITIE